MDRGPRAKSKEIDLVRASRLLEQAADSGHVSTACCTQWYVEYGLQSDPN